MTRSLTLAATACVVLVGLIGSAHLGCRKQDSTVIHTRAQMKYGLDAHRFTDLG